MKTKVIKDNNDIIKLSQPGDVYVLKGQLTMGRNTSSDKGTQNVLRIN